MPKYAVVSESRICERETRIPCRSLLIESCGAIVCFAFVRALCLAFLVFTLEKQIIGFGIASRRCGEGIRLARRELRLKLGGNCFGNLALDCKDVTQWSIVAFRPQVRVGFCV